MERKKHVMGISFYIREEEEGAVVANANFFFDLFSGWRSVSGLCVVRGGIGGPKGQIVTQKLHDQR